MLQSPSPEDDKLPGALPGELAGQLSLWDIGSQQLYEDLQSWDSWAVLQPDEPGL